MEKIIKNGGRLQCHSKTHPHLEVIDNYEMLEKEIIVPEYLKKLDAEGFEFLLIPSGPIAIKSYA